MKRSLFLRIAALLICSLVSIAYGADEGSANKENARFALYVVEINKNPTPLLLDTRTGRIWLYEDEGGFGSKKKSFKGATVEGLAYSSGEDVKTLERQLDQWQVDGLLDKEVIGFKSAVLGEFSYSMDLMKVIKINDESIILQKRVKEEKK